MAKELVLMVDDELDNRVMMRYFLESWGYEVELAANGQEALEKVAARRPSLVLLDLEMPVMDGFETCNRLKGDPDTEHIPVIMFTGLEATADKVKGIRRGADDYVVKTVDPEEIQARVEMILRRSKRYEAKASEADSNASDAVLSGTLKDKHFPEAFQLAMAYGKTGSLVLKNGELEGRVYLDEGNVVHATYGELEGEAAFFELSVWNEGQFSYVVGEPPKKTTIQTSGTSLLMEATRRMDEWNLISSKIPNFDVVPHRVSSTTSESIRLTKTDWRVLSRVDGRQSIRSIAEAVGIDHFDCGRTIFGLMTLGVLSFEPDKTDRDTFYDAVPELRAEPAGQEPYELSATHWKILACIDGKRDLGVLTHLAGLSPRKMAEFLKDLVDRGFVRVNKQREASAFRATPATSASPKGGPSEANSGKVEAFAPRIRAIGFE